jgi:hypothetical protein
MSSLMTQSKIIMDGVMGAILTIPQSTRCDDREVMEVASRFKEVLTVFD